MLRSQVKPAPLAEDHTPAELGPYAVRFASIAPVPCAFRCRGIQFECLIGVDPVCSNSNQEQKALASNELPVGAKSAQAYVCSDLAMDCMDPQVYSQAAILPVSGRFSIGPYMPVARCWGAQDDSRNVKAGFGRSRPCFPRLEGGEKVPGRQP